MKTKIEIKSIFGELIFSYEKEDNTIKDTVEEAVKQRYDLRNANLYNADLRNADLSYADLSNADLSNADLRNADLRNANLYNANLYNANLGDWGRLQCCSDVLYIHPIGSRNGNTTIFNTDKGVFVLCGCFRGTLDEFVKKVKETHGDNKHSRDYLALVDFVKTKYIV